MTTFQLTKSNHCSVVDGPFNIGKIIKIKGQKRRCLQIRDINNTPHERIVSLILVYNPSPRSRLNRRGVFSKMKGIII